MQMAVETVNIKNLKQETLINLKLNHSPMAQPRPIFCVVKGQQWRLNFDFETKFVEQFMTFFLPQGNKNSKFSLSATK